MSNPWEYSGCIEHNGQTLHLWNRLHDEGFIAFGLTVQPTKMHAPLDPPQGGGFYTSLDGVARVTGIPFEKLIAAYGNHT